MTTKQCTLCKLDLEFTSFSIKRGRPGQKNGLVSRCKRCVGVLWREKYRIPKKRSLEELPTGHKKCKTCVLVLPLADFHPSCKSPIKLWHYDSNCKSCTSLKNKQRIRQTHYIRPSTKTIEHMLIESKRKGVVNGYHRHNRLIPFTIGVADVKQVMSDRCAITGVKLDLSCTGMPLSPSIDRIDNSKGYEPGNIRITSLLYNLMRNKWSDELVIKSLKEVAKSL